MWVGCAYTVDVNKIFSGLFFLYQSYPSPFYIRVSTNDVLELSYLLFVQILWFWRALRSFDQADRARFLQFVTGTSKVPLQGFAFLEGMNGTQRFQIHRDDRSTDRLPCAHTW